MKNNRAQIRSKNLSRTILVVAVVIVANMLSQRIFHRFDLTSEKRYTISENTKEILRNLDDVVFIRVYLDGELNIPFQNFQKGILELLDEFHVYGRSNLQFELVNPLEGLSAQEIQNVLKEMDRKGLRPTNIYNRKKDGTKTEKLILPGADIVYKGVELSINLLINDPTKSSEQNLNASVEALEYNLISAIKNLVTDETEKIAFVEGHGEWPEPFVADIMKEFSKSYQVDRGVINGQTGILDAYKAIVIAGPVKEFSEQDKYVIDQYVMRGGKVMWLLDAVNVDFDSLAMGQTLAFPNTVNLEDILFKYGVRINNDIVQDAQSSKLPINVALAGEAPRFQAEPWIYYPLITPPSGNVVTNNLNKVQLKFASTIDTIEARKNIVKTPVLVSSVNSKVLNTPRIVQLQEIGTSITEIDFNAPNKLIGVMLEGEFESVFKNRMLDEYFDAPPTDRLDKSQKNKMVVIADADIIRNEVKRNAQGQPGIFPLGFDRLTNQTYGNKELLVNLMSYLTGNKELLELRGREFKLRLLDKKRIAEERVKWQIVNVVLPLLIIAMFGVVYNILRKRRYGR